MDKGLAVAEISAFEAQLTEQTVVRVVRKIIGIDSVIDARLWRTDKLSGKRYPTRKGLCLKDENWKIVLKLFKDNGLPYDTETNS